MVRAHEDRSLDAFFFVFTGKLAVDGDLEDNPRVMKLLAELKRAVEEGVETQQLQREPHLLLLSRSFYNERLRPILAQWLLQFIRMQRQRQLDDNAVVAYLLHRQKPPNGALDRATDETMKLLNISHDWCEVRSENVRK